MPKPTCLACGQVYDEKEVICPRCLVKTGDTTLAPASQGGPVQLVRIYWSSSDATKPYVEEAAILQKVGWKVYSQALGGGLGTKVFGARKPPTYVSVVYERI